jgi:hypothetical protein
MIDPLSTTALYVVPKFNATELGQCAWEGSLLLGALCDTCCLLIDAKFLTTLPQAPSSMNP